MIANIVIYTMMLLCGINIPLEALPVPAQIAGQLIPMTNGLLAIRAVIAGESYTSALPLIGKEVLVGLTFSLVAWQAFQYRLRITRATGAFDLM